MIMINGDIAYEGTLVNGFTVLKIHEDRVEFTKDGNTLVQTLSHIQTSDNAGLNYCQKQLNNFKNSIQLDSNSYYKQYRQNIYSRPLIAENGSCYGQISEITGRPKTVYVQGYYRKDGTYVRSHYRSRPRR